MKLEDFKKEVTKKNNNKNKGMAEFLFKNNLYLESSMIDFSTDLERDDQVVHSRKVTTFISDNISSFSPLDIFSSNRIDNKDFGLEESLPFHAIPKLSEEELEHSKINFQLYVEHLLNSNSFEEMKKSPDMISLFVEPKKFHEFILNPEITTKEFSEQCGNEAIENIKTRKLGNYSNKIKGAAIPEGMIHKLDELPVIKEGIVIKPEGSVVGWLKNKSSSIFQKGSKNKFKK